MIESTTVPRGVGSGGHHETRFLWNRARPRIPDDACFGRDGWM